MFYNPMVLIYTTAIQAIHLSKTKDRHAPLATPQVSPPPLPQEARVPPLPPAQLLGRPPRRSHPTDPTPLLEAQSPEAHRDGQQDPAGDDQEPLRPPPAKHPVGLDPTLLAGVAELGAPDAEDGGPLALPGPVPGRVEQVEGGAGRDLAGAQHPVRGGAGPVVPEQRGRQVVPGEAGEFLEAPRGAGPVVEAPGDFLAAGDGIVEAVQFGAGAVEVRVLCPALHEGVQWRVLLGGDDCVAALEIVNDVEGLGDVRGNDMRLFVVGVRRWAWTGCGCLWREEVRGHVCRTNLCRG